MEPDYSKREMDIIYGEIRETLERIEKQVIKTNGRVNFLERFMWTSIGVVSLLSMFNISRLVTLLTN